MPWAAIVEIEDGLTLRQITKPQVHGPARATNSAEAEEWAVQQYHNRLVAIVEIELNSMGLITELLRAISPYFKRRLAKTNA